MAIVDFLTGAVDLNAGASYSGGALPLAGDTLNFSTPGADITTNPTALGTIDLLEIVLGAGLTRNLGSATAYVNLLSNRTSTGKLKILSPSDAAYIQGGSAGTGVIYEAILAPINASMQVFAKGWINTIWRQFAGVAKVLSDSTISQVLLDGGYLDVFSHASDIIDGAGRVGNATMYTRRRVTGAMTIGNRGIVRYDVDTTDTSGTFTVQAGGTLIVEAGDITADLSPGGVLDLRNLKKDYTFDLTTSRLSRVLLGRIRPTINETRLDGVGATYITS